MRRAREIDVEPVDRVVARIAAARGGVVTRAELLTAGLTRHGVAHRVTSGHLHLLHRGVYAVGHTALTSHAHHHAAVLACGPGAALSHVNAAIEWSLMPCRGDDVVHVTQPGRCRRSRAGLHVHRGHLPDDDLTCRYGIPMTSPARTLLDLATVMPSRDVARAVNEARVLRLVGPAQLKRLEARAAGRRGAEVLREALTGNPGPTRSELERALLGLVQRAELPAPQTNTRVHGFEVDAYWPAHRLVVEVDGYSSHSSRDAFENDRRRDAALHATGLRVLRFTWRRLSHRPEAVAAQLAAVLATAGGAALGEFRPARAWPARPIDRGAPSARAGVQRGGG